MAINPRAFANCFLIACVFGGAAGGQPGSIPTSRSVVSSLWADGAVQGSGCFTLRLSGCLRLENISLHPWQEAGAFQMISRAGAVCISFCVLPRAKPGA